MLARFPARIKGCFSVPKCYRIVPLAAFRIVYLGIPIGALALVGDGLCILAACISRPNFPGMRRLRTALAREGAPVFARPDLGDPDLSRILRSAKPDLVVSYFWHQRVPAAVRELAPEGAIGVHPSLLPRHRGADPVFWALRAGDATTGVTVHVLDEGYDTGATIAARSIAVDPRWNAHALSLALDRPALEALRDTCARLARGEVLARTPQDEALATLAPEPSEDDLEIRWRSPSEDVLRLVRAAAPAPGAFSEYGPSVLTVLAASPTALQLDPGVAAILDQGVVVGTADRAVRLDAVRVDDADEVLRGPDVAAALPGASDLRGRS